jgi:signal transduction histidine kinase
MQHDAEVLDLLEGAQAELEALRSAHGQTLDTLAHDLRSPLLTLNLSLEMLRIKPHDPAQLEERREVMKRQADQLKALAAGLRQPMPPLPLLPDAGDTHGR